MIAQVAIAFISLALLLAADGVYVVLQLRPALTATADSLREARRALRSGDTQGAARAIQAARTRAGDATNLIQHPGIVIASYLPGLRSEARGLIGLANASELAAQAGSEGVQAVRTIGLGEEGIAASVYRDGQVDLDALDDAVASATNAAQLLADAESILDAAGTPRIPLLQDAVADARTEVADAASMARTGSLLFQSLPPLLGRDGERRYLLAFQALGEARATGGLVGLQGVLQAEDGRVRLTSLGSSGGRGLYAGHLEPVPAPAWFEAAYESQAATVQWRQANISPNFPAAAEVLLEMYEATTGERLGGVVAMDPIALQELMRGLEPIQAPGLDAPITDANAAEVLLEDSYLALGNEEAHNDYLAEVVREFWARVRAGDVVNVTDSAEGLVDAVKGQHFKVYVRNPDAAEPLDELGTGGDYSDLGPNVQMAFHNNYAANKIDYYLRRAIHTRVKLERDGSAQVVTKVRLSNETPAGPAELLPGRATEPPGLNRMVINLLGPKGAEFEPMKINGAPVGPFLYNDDEHPVVWAFTEIPPGDESTVRVAYRLPGAAQLIEDSMEFTLSLFPQATAVPDSFKLAITGPKGALVESVSGASRAAGARVRAAGTLSEPQTTRVTYQLP